MAPLHGLPYEELTYDHGYVHPVHVCTRASLMCILMCMACIHRYVVGSVEGKTLRCLCGAASCRGFLF